VSAIIPAMADEPTQQLDDARRLLDGGDPDAASAIAMPLTANSDPDVAGEAWLIVGTARYRTDDEAGALAAWQAAANAGGRNAWLGSRSAAEQLVRDGDLEGAITAYREADRRAPPAERGAIANRIAWLLKETGHDFASRRQFNRARGAYATHTPIVTYAIIAICVVLFAIDAVLTSGGTLGGGLFGGGVGPIGEANLINAFAVAEGEWWRIFTSAFIHLGPIHLAFNMIVLWQYGSLVERIYGPIEYAVIYLLCAAGGSVLTILVDPVQSAAGASGAIFGLVGLLFVVSRRHHAVLGREARMMVAGIGGFVVYLLIFTFLVPGISWTGHLGGLFVGAVLGFFLPPTGVATMSGMWRTSSGEQLNRGLPLVLRAAVYLGVALVLAIGSYVAVERLVG
jgi:membrane associated rhomboid family serine protease